MKIILKLDFKILDKMESQPMITQQERKILQLISLMKKNKEIGEELFISPHTVKNHKANLIRKLNLKSSSELLIYSFSVV